MNTSKCMAFAGEKHAAIYSKYRPKASHQVIDKILKFLKEKRSSPFSSAVDVACGSGQSTSILSKHFKSVLGCDVSEAQVREASKACTATNTQYCVADAEHLPVDDESVDLVTVSQAAHWLNFPAFCKEVDRVLAPYGCLAVFERNHVKLLHDDDFVANKLNELFISCKLKTLAPYWNYSVHPTSWNGYADLAIPYSDFERHVLREYVEMTPSELIGYLKSLSAYQKFHKEYPDNVILKELHDRMLQTLGLDKSSGEVILKAVYPIHLLLGRKPQNS